jgi:hypothetical protein
MQPHYVGVRMLHPDKVSWCLQGFAKLDLLAPTTHNECAVATVAFADLAWGGEPLFVPRSQDTNGCSGRSPYNSGPSPPYAVAI